MSGDVEAQADQAYDDVLVCRQMMQMLDGKNVVVLTEELIRKDPDLCLSLMHARATSDFFGVASLRKHLRRDRRPGGRSARRCAPPAKDSYR